MAARQAIEWPPKRGHPRLSSCRRGRRFLRRLGDEIGDATGPKMQIVGQRLSRRPAVRSAAALMPEAA